MSIRSEPHDAGDEPGAPYDPPRHPPAAGKGRGTGWQIVHRYQRRRSEAVDDGWPDEAGGGDAGLATGLGDGLGDAVSPAVPRTEVREERAGRILSRNDSPDIPFELALNPYRGCEHGCIYCYARPTHAYLDLSPGLDFETRLIAKVNAVERLRAELARPAYVPSPINIGSATDAYQPIERHWRLTRGVLELLDSCRHPATLVTKSGGVLRDLDLLAAMAARRQVIVFVSLTTLDPALARILEPRAAAPARRLAAIAGLARAGVWVGVNVAPVIPFVNEPEIEALLGAAAAAGARSAHWTVLRLPWEVAPLFRDWLRQHFPDRADRVMARLREMRGGKDYDADFAQRMRGQGLWAELIRQRVEKAAARHGLQRRTPELDISAFVPPVAVVEPRRPVADARQAPLF